jgi:phospholipid/cholesterol/gamma-HCH transport system substrate-binding protein
VDTLNKEMPELLDRAGDTFARLDDLAERLDWLIATGQEALDGPGGARDALAYAGDAARELDLRLPAVIDDTEDLIGRTKAAVDEARGSLDRLERELTATTGRARSLMGKAESVLAGVDAGQLNADLHSLSVEMTDTVQETRRTLAGILAQATEVLARVGELAAAVKEGKGTLGALLMDRELYDDIRELVLDLKSNPWKVLWKP